MTDVHPSSARVARRERRPWRSLALHAMRVLLVIVIVLLVRHQHAETRAARELARAMRIDSERLSQFYGGTLQQGDWDRERGARIVTDAKGETLGFVVQTSPQSDHIVGYLGPTNVLIAFDRDYRVLGVDVLHSEDTVEHVKTVRADPRFFESYRELSWQEAANQHDVDAVTGATLTSLAIVEAIANRLGAPCPSLRFPNPITVSELQQWCPNGVALRQRNDQPLVHDILDQQQKQVGAVIRTSPVSDNVMGYQGPTDTLVLLDEIDRVQAISLRSSYDNQPYVTWVKDDNYFESLVRSLSLRELGEADLQELGVEGVSGATMTSLAVADAVVAVAKDASVRRELRARVMIGMRDYGTLVILGLALLMTFTHLRGWPRLRTAYQILLVGYLGFCNGDMLSQALFVGWAQSGVPWRLAPGLVLLTFAALLVPVFSKRQLYCQHICPFGAAQQLLHTYLPYQRRVPRWLTRVSRVIVPVLLVVVVVTAMLHLPVNLASIEPFDSFVFWIAGAATLIVAATGLLASFWVPMAYCRYGCPTGALLGFLRFHGRSDRLSYRDLFAIALLLLAVICLH